MLRLMTPIARSPIAVIGFALLLLPATGMVGGGLPGPASESGVQQSVGSTPTAPDVSWTPQTPGEGRLFQIMVRASAGSPISGAHGQVAGEELHFERMGGGLFQSLAAVPVGSEGVVTAELRVVYESGAEETFTREIPIVEGVYAHERLSVAPRFGTAPDSADQAQLARDQAMAREVSRVSHRTPRAWGDAVVLPRNGRVTSGFGDGREFNGQISSRHMGLDLQGTRGDTVVAAAAGTVALVEPFLLAGNIVYINHGGGLLSAYFHLSRQLVTVGDTVRAGDPVGLVGATGRVTGPHLHWVVRYGRTSVDPRSLLEVVGPG
jgi:murein DD-endopeptidase MepM/ murein hydrolase activator NlpD